ncbi:MAG: GTP-binding protein [bacterium]|nr:GTP-binding protein [bacterium]
MAETVRPPVVTILGHVDHGKTTLLDFIRQTTVAAREVGGITQATSAYQVEHQGKLITFIDTPGHAAFEKMRARGAKLADIAILVVAVDDGVMPQTVEAIKHIKSAGIPMIVALNKVDLPGIDVKVQTEKIKKQLSDKEVLIEEYGGDVPLVPVSAKTGQGVPELLETITLVAEIHELKGDSQKPAEGIIIESRLDKFRGPVATVLVRDGTLKRGDKMAVGEASGKVRGMTDWSGKIVDKAGPSMPVEVLGFEKVPPVGVNLGEVKGAEGNGKAKAVSLIERLKETGSEVLNVVVKADKQGSLEAITTALEKFNEEKQLVKVLSSGTGDITYSDIGLAVASKAIVLGFNVKVVPTAQRLAEVNNVLIRTYNIIYELLDEMEDVVEGILQPGKVEEVFGRAQIIAEFPYGKGEKIAGCKILEGTISKGPKVRLVRDGEVVGEMKIKSLKRLKEEVSKVEKGQECGMIFDTAIEFTPGDIVESFRLL